jgi:adenylate kinase family enzyme
MAAARNMPLKVVELQIKNTDNGILNERRLMRIEQYRARGKEPRAEDLNEQKFWRRLELYDGVTSKVADHYESRGQLVRVNGLQSPQAVWSEIRQKLNFGTGPGAVPRPSL